MKNMAYTSKLHTDHANQVSVQTKNFAFCLYISYLKSETKITEIYANLHNINNKLYRLTLLTCDPKTTCQILVPTQPGLAAVSLSKKFHNY